jgi:hypothetical protein
MIAVLPWLPDNEAEVDEFAENRQVRRRATL